MKASKRKLLETKGWEVASTKEFLELSEEELAYIELKLTLSEYLKQCRQKNKLTQTELARLLRSSQSRVAKMESGDPSVTLDLLIRSLLRLGATKEALAKTISPSQQAPSL